jgi:two-component system chemotaxis sensor kinase CheA
LINYLRLPREVTEYEAAHLKRMNRVALAFFWLHVPVFVVIAAVAGGGRIEETLLLALGVMFGPTVAYTALKEQPRTMSVVFGVTAMLMGGVLVYIDRGPMQIEMHFYFFVLIALLSVFGNPMAVLAAAATVAGHHLVLWLVMPETVFNYNATLWSVVVHAIFVVLESVAACFVARSFFDNVLGLERIVRKRNGDMARVLDNVAQGFVTVGFDGTMGAEHSRALATWFGEPPANARWWDYAAATADETAWIKMGFEGLVDGFMPIECTLDTLPAKTTRGGRELAFEYKPIGSPPSELLVVVSDVTEERARMRAELVQRELVAVMEKASPDRAGFAAFLREGAELVEMTSRPGSDTATVLRCLHTLKGNAGLFGATSLVETAHELESALAEQDEPMTSKQQAQLRDAWQAFEARIAPLGVSSDRSVIVARDEFEAVVDTIEVPTPAWAQRVQAWGLDPTRPHLARLGEQAIAVAVRLEKTPPIVAVSDHDVRLDGERFQPVFAALVHAVRNAVSHGIEAPDERVAAGKPEAARIALSTEVHANTVVIEVRDDGAGVDWDGVRERAIVRGLPTASRRDLEETLFATGFSMATEVSEISGRGVGLDALRATCRDAGGDVEIHSERGEGTTVRCTFSLDAPAEQLRASA